MIIDLIDGTYELFRHFYGLRRFTKGEGRPYGAVVGVLNGVLEMIEGNVAHVGVATDHVIESFRDNLWPGYKTGEGIEPALLAQFHPLEEGLAAMGVAAWPMIELEADDALATAARLADEDKRVELVCGWPRGGYIKAASRAIRWHRTWRPRERSWRNRCSPMASCATPACPNRHDDGARCRS
jgi:hypothetical protein